MIKFENLNLGDPIKKSLKELGYETPTPIQSKAIPLILAHEDILGIAQTGTGKTAAFSLPIINLIALNKTQIKPKRTRALILTPTRELAIQIHNNLKLYGRYVSQKYVVIFGGVGQGTQVSDLKNGCDILVATPGRLLDLIQQKHLNLDNVEFFILDEADRMLDMGFLQDVKKIISFLPEKKQTLFFSATMPNEIQKLSHNILRNPKKIEITPPSTTVEKIEQSVMFVQKADKLNLLIYLLKKIHQENNKHKVLVFVQMKHVANRITEKLLKSGILTSAIHGNKSQTSRQKAIHDFSNHRIQVLVATDLASRGIDIEGITHVINFELSNIAENYVHRIGRTARAGTKGSAISLVTADEKSYLAHIEFVTRQKIPIFSDQPFHSLEALNAKVMSVGKAKSHIEKQSIQSKNKNKNKRFNQGRRKKF